MQRPTVPPRCPMDRGANWAANVACCRCCDCCFFVRLYDRSAEKSQAIRCGSSRPQTADRCRSQRLGPANLTLYFYEYFDLEVSLLFGETSIANLNATAVELELKRHPAMQSLFNAAARQLGEFDLLATENSGRAVKFALQLQLETFSLCGEPVVEVGFCGSARLISREVLSPAVFSYGEPNADSRYSDIQPLW